MPKRTDIHKILVIGSGPIRIGQGVEFDYSTVHAVSTIKKAGYEAIIINNNPETVSTDYTCSDKLYFEPLCAEDVMNIVLMEKPVGVIASLGGQTAINLAQPLMERGVKIIGTDCQAIERAENRDSFEKILEQLNIPQPQGRAVTNIEYGVSAAEQIGYPVLVRPSFVLGGRAMQIVANEEQLRHYLKTAVEVDEDKPVLVDKYIQGKEVEVDAVCDGTDVFVPGIMELVERTGIHSGDSISVYPPFSISQKVRDTILDYTEKLGLGIGYDKSMTRALFKALQASGMNVMNYGTVFVTVADCDKEEVLPLVRRFYNMGFNIEATRGTAEFLKAHGIRTRVRRKISEGYTEILDSLRQGYVTYVINTRDVSDHDLLSDGHAIRQCAVENNVSVFTALDTVRVLLDVLEETTLGISTIDG